jgi:hypothetical protein
MNPKPDLPPNNRNFISIKDLEIFFVILTKKLGSSRS